MAQKRASPLDEPPSPTTSSDSEEENEASSQEEQPSSEQHPQEDKEGASSSSSSSSEDDDEVQPPSPLPPSSNKLPSPATNSDLQPSSSDSATQSDSESDSEDRPPPSTVTINPKVKPLTSKLIEETPKPKPQPPANPARSTSKRPSENNGRVNDPKRVKKVMDAPSDDVEIPETADDGKKSGDDSKKLFQRLWSEEDEIVILKGMVEFSSKNRLDPVKDANAFYEFIKNSLHVDASRDQLKQKIRRLKKKFEVNVEKGKNDEGPNFTKPHDQKAFELSKKIWANGGGANGVVEKVANGLVEKAKSNGKARNSQKEGKKKVASPKPKSETFQLDSKESEKMDIDEKTDTTLHLSEMIRCDKSLGLSALNEDVVKRGVELLGPSKTAELERRWKKLQVAELELYVKRTELIEDQARLMLEAHKSSIH